MTTFTPDPIIARVYEGGSTEDDARIKLNLSYDWSQERIDEEHASLVAFGHLEPEPGCGVPIIWHFVERPAWMDEAAPAKDMPPRESVVVTVLAAIAMLPAATFLSRANLFRHVVLSYPEADGDAITNAITDIRADVTTAAQVAILRDQWGGVTYGPNDGFITLEAQDGRRGKRRATAKAAEKPVKVLRPADTMEALADPNRAKATCQGVVDFINDELEGPTPQAMLMEKLCEAFPNISTGSLRFATRGIRSHAKYRDKISMVTDGAGVEHIAPAEH